MYIIKLYNRETKKSFEKSFESFYIYDKFKKKLKYSKKLVILSTEEF